jgi:hypothetical protein
VEKARNPKHQFFGNTEEVLKQYALVGSDWNLHDLTRDFILRHVSGDGLDMSFDF